MAVRHRAATRPRPARVRETVPAYGEAVMAGPRRTRRGAVGRLPPADSDPLGRMLAADEGAIWAGRTLRAFPYRALFGAGYDPAAYDAAVLAYRAAQAGARAARLTWVRWRERGTAASRAA